MKIEKLTENKIRIILKVEELTKKNIDFFSLTKNTDIAERLFKTMLKQAEKEVGFNSTDSKLLIEAATSSDGLCIITFTKLAPEKALTLEPKLKLKIRRKPLNYKYKDGIYEFVSFEEFCNFCAYLNNSNLKSLDGFSKQSFLYEYNEKYFLIFSNINVDFKYTYSLYTSISEFAKFVSNSNSISSKILEYGKPIFKNNAIKNGMKYFVKV